MNKLAVGLAAFAFGCSSANAVEVTKSVEVSASSDATWKAIGDFCGIASWHPAVAKCEIGDKNGAVTRTLTLKDGAKIFEKQLNFAPGSYTYSILEPGPLPVANYESTLSVKPEGAGAKIVWTGKFDPKGDEVKAVDAIGGVYQGGLDALKANLK